MAAYLTTWLSKFIIPRVNFEMMVLLGGCIPPLPMLSKLNSTDARKAAAEALYEVSSGLSDDRIDFAFGRLMDSRACARSVKDVGKPGRKENEFGLMIREMDEESSMSGKTAGVTSGKGAGSSTPLLEVSNSDSKAPLVADVTNDTSHKVPTVQPEVMPNGDKVVQAPSAAPIPVPVSEIVIDLSMDNSSKKDHVEGVNQTLVTGDVLDDTRTRLVDKEYEAAFTLVQKKKKQIAKQKGIQHTNLKLSGNVLAGNSPRLRAARTEFKPDIHIHTVSKEAFFFMTL
ncbi:Uncharacterized protein Fot_37951 [Forsythia ovata]|uniref:Uncharacterized protein n=1 Tax=Forsythia ovata TaxID=205694 RepID=A0ABD1S0F3_9LAMI